MDNKLAPGNMKQVDLRDVDMEELLKAIDSCKGQVWFITNEGDKLNMKSQLCRMLGILKIIEGGRFSGGRLECDNIEDASKLFRFNLYGNKK